MYIILIRELNPFYDASASGNRFASLVKGLKEQDVDVSILVTGGYSSKQEIDEMKGKTSCRGIPVTYLLRLQNHTLWHRRINKYVLSYLTNLLLPYKIKRELRKGYDYLWVTNNYPILAFLNNNQQSIHNSLLEINEFHDIYMQAGNITNKAQIKFAKQFQDTFLTAIRKIDHFAIMTNTLLEYYKKMAKPEANFMHLPMTVDLSRFSDIPKTPNQNDYIAFAGSLNSAKDGVNILIEAFAKIATVYPALQLRLAGEYHPDILAQKELIRKYGLEDRVKYIGLLTRDQIPGFFVDAKILTLARPDSHQAQGGFPTKLGEYLATKNPVCVTRVGEIPQYLEDNISAYMAEPGDVDSFANALQRALSNDDKAKQVGFAGYEVAFNNFNMEVQAKRLKAFLDKN